MPASNAPHQEQIDAAELTWPGAPPLSTLALSENPRPRLLKILRPLWLDSPAAASSSLPLGSRCKPARHDSASELEALLNRQDPALTVLEAQALDLPPGCLAHLLSQTKPILQMKTGKNKPADLLTKGKQVTSFSFCSSFSARHSPSVQNRQQQETRKFWNVCKSRRAPEQEASDNVYSRRLVVGG